ncbi:bicyclomycin resistance protein [Sodalis glossinidius str. 'morsitans']|uniref:Bcr/CflA family efflux transporter n=2 Tax=Sodalis glossinidius TaxID=63612 RepID=Q2NSN1_SODGM|nr:bicyclomycin resistance protein [Sodalis glossinidius str. 'morsitans']
MHPERKKHVGIVVILGLLSMLMPLAIDMYLPALPIIATEYGVSAGSVQMTLSAYVLGFAIGQLFYGPMADCLGRKPVIMFGTFCFALAAAACALSQSVEMLIYMRLLHGLAAAAASVVINALMRDMFTKDDFSRMMSFVVLVMTVAPLLAPIIGGGLLVLLSWHAIFWTIGLAALVATGLVLVFIRETLPRERRQKFRLSTTIGNFGSLFRHKRVFSYMLASGFSFAGMFSFLSAGPFVYIDLNDVSPQNFGYYFALNVVFLFILTLINSRFVARFAAQSMFRLGLTIQFSTCLWMIVVLTLHLGFIPLVVGVALFVGCVAMVTSNGMAVILEDFPHMAGTASSLAGTLRFGVGAIIGALLSLSTFNSAWPMVLSMAICSSVALLLYLYASRPRKGKAAGRAGRLER